MSDENAKSNEPGGSNAGGASWLIVLLIMVLALAAGAGGSFFFLSKPQPAAPAESVAEVEEEPLDPGSEFQSRLVSLEPFVVNVAGEAYPRFLKLKIELEADSEKTKKELDARRPQVRDTTILLLASKRLPEVSEFEGRALLKEDLKSRISALLDDGQVSAVMFTEFVVQ